MPKLETLADLLGTDGPPSPPSAVELPDCLDASLFAERVLGSREFRQYIVNGLTLGDIPSAVVCRLMDYAWGRPTERVEHSAPGGGPVVAVIERIIVDPLRESREERSYSTH